jgi:hypothetical protein
MGRKASPQADAVKRAAREKAREAGAVMRMRVCHSRESDLWSVMLYFDAGREVNARQFIWNEQTQRLEAAPPFKGIPKSRFQAHLTAKEPGRTCEIISPGSGSSRENGAATLPRGGANRGAHAGQDIVPPEPAAADEEAVSAGVSENRDRLGTEPANGSDSRLPDHDRQTVNHFLSNWKSAWEAKDLEVFRSLYHSNFRSDKLDQEKFMEVKRKLFEKYRTIKVDVDGVEIRKVRDRFVVKFVQGFQGDSYRDRGKKTLVLVPSGGAGLRIITERWSSI